MTDLLAGVQQAPRILIEAQLKPIQGTRFQPTGFPSLGAAEFRSPTDTRMLLVESAQSMANRLEGTTWDEAENDLVHELKGLPYVATSIDGRTTDSIREAHRINSPYLYQGIKERLEQLSGITGRKPKKGDGESDESAGADIRALARAVFNLDPNSVLHGVFLEKLVGTARLTRILSAFIEAEGVTEAESGGVKNDRVDAKGAAWGGASKGFGNVPFARTEYTAKAITAYFSIDAALLRSYGLGIDAENLLIALALWKIQRFLASGARLRTACDLEPLSPASITVTRPTGWALPSLADLDRLVADGIARCRAAKLFADPPKTVVEFSTAAK